MADSYPFIVSNGQYYPGLMYVYNDLDGSSAWYPGNQDHPSWGGCGPPNSDPAGRMQAVTDCPLKQDENALFGMTVCPINFDLHLLLDLGPLANSRLAEINYFLAASDLVNLHEMFHVLTHCRKIRHSNVCKQLLLEIC